MSPTRPASALAGALGPTAWILWLPPRNSLHSPQSTSNPGAHKKVTPLIPGRWQMTRRSTFANKVALAVLLVGGLAGRATADDWPQWLGPQRDGVWREMGL